MDRTTRPGQPVGTPRLTLPRRLAPALLPLMLAASPAVEASAQRVADGRAASPTPTAPTGRARAGAMVRVRLRPDGAAYRSRLRSLDSAAVVLDPTSRGGAARRVELAVVEALEVRRPMGARRVLGFAAGGAAGVALLFALYNSDDGSGESGFVFSPWPDQLSIPVGALFGGMAGMVLGVRTAPERWERVPLAPR